MLFKSANLRQIDIIGSVIAAGVVAAAYGIGFRPLFGAMADRVAIEDTLQHASQVNRESGQGALQLRRAIAALDEQLSGVHRLSDRTQVNHTISLVTERALLRGLIVESGTAEDPIEGEMYAVIPIHISGKGDFIATSHFIQELTDNHADIEVRSFTLDSGSNTTGHTPGFGIELAWYVLPD